MKKFIKVSSFLLAFAMIVTSFVMFSANTHVHAAISEPVAYGNGTPAAVSSVEPGTSFPLKTITEGGRFYFTHTNDYDGATITVAHEEVNDGRYKNASGNQVSGQAISRVTWSWQSNRSLALYRPLNETEGFVAGLDKAGANCLTTAFVFVAPVDGYYSAAATYSCYYSNSGYSMTIKTATKEIAKTSVAEAQSTAWNTVSGTNIYLNAGDELSIVHVSTWWNHSGTFKELNVTYLGEVEQKLYPVIKDGEFNTTNYTYYTKNNLTTTEIAGGTALTTAATGSSLRGGLTGLTGFGASATAPYIFKAGDVYGMQVSNGRTYIVFEAPQCGKYTLTTDVWLYGAQDVTSGTTKHYQRTTFPVLVEQADGSFVATTETSEFAWDGPIKTTTRVLTLEKGQKVAISVRSYDAATVKINDISFLYTASTCTESNELGFDATQHWTKCENCGELIGEKENHTGGTATCVAKKECTVCGETYGDFADHTPATDYSKDADYHWKECSVNGCGETIDGSREEHDFTNGNCVCGQPKPACDHANCTKTYTNNGDDHTATYTCGAVDTTDTAHNFDTSDTCVCGAEKPACDHANCRKTYTNNGDDHVAVWSCGEVDANDTEHDFTAGNCACGAKKPAPQTGDTATSISIALAAMAITGFAVFTKKRKH